MIATKCLCPSCGAVVKAARGLPDKVNCPRCGCRFASAENGVARSQRPVYPVARPVAPPPSSRSFPTRSLVIGVAGFFVLGLLLLAYCLRDPQPAGAQASEAATPAPLPAPAVPPPSRPAPPNALPPERQAAVDRALERGVAYLKAEMLAIGNQDVAQMKDNWMRTAFTGHFRGNAGAVALAGLTLLECGVPPNDAAVANAAAAVRAAGPTMNYTYSLAATLLFLDRLADARDRGLIRTLGLRLAAGQNANGGWTYNCPLLGPEEEQKFLEALNALTPLERIDNLYPRDGEKLRAPVEAPKPRVELPPSLRDLPVLNFQPGQPADPKPVMQLPLRDDNSNTQFAILGAWAARKHGVPLEHNLLLAERRFRGSQNFDGSWGYVPNSDARPDSMTCAGLLGLAVGRGLEHDIRLRRDKLLGTPARVQNVAPARRDDAVERGLAFLGRTIGQPALPRGNGQAGNGQQLMHIGNVRGKLLGARSWGDIYFLWSVERVAVVYDLPRIDGKDWYAWGAEVLVNSQEADGSWKEHFPGLPDTCFALLFLKRVNVVRDLTSKLKFYGGDGK